jgi:hypothetical protein
MSRRERPTLPEFDAQAVQRLAEMPGTPGTSAISDDEPPSGIMLRPEVLARIPRLVLSTSELTVMPLDHRAGFILSFIDGTYSIEMILDACAMGRDEALEILGKLIARGIIAVE